MEFLRPTTLGLLVGPGIRVRTGFLLVVAILTSISGCCCPWTSTNAQLEDSSRWLQSGIEAFHDGQHQEAEQLLVQAIDSRPGDPILRQHLASIYLERGKMSEAISQLMKAAEISGEDASIYVRIGQIYLANGQLIPARQYALKALDADRKYPESWVLNADIEFAKGQLNQALNDYQRALSLKSDYPDVQLKVAEIHRMSGRPLRAFSTLEHMLSAMPYQQQPEEALLLAGRLLIELKRPAQAVEKLSLAASRNEASPIAFLQLANAQLVMGMDIDAQKTLAKAEKRFPGQANIVARRQELQNANERFAVVNAGKEPLIR